MEAYPTHVSKTSWWESLLPYLSVIVVVVLGVILIRSILGANQKSFNFGKTKAHVAHAVKVKFADVAGKGRIAGDCGVFEKPTKIY